jgi:hypothetical protein
VTSNVAVIMPVGHHPVEVERCRDTTASITAWEPAVRWIVLIDDAEEPRELVGATGSDGPEVIVLPPPVCAARAGTFDRITANVLAGMAWVAENTTANVVMKIDTDALVIAPFSDKIARALAEDGSIGLVGSYSRTCTGAARDFSPWVATLQRAGRWLQWGQHRPHLAVGRRGLVRRIVHDARAAGYCWGEHALACAFAIPCDLILDWRDDALLDDVCLFLGSDLGDDPVLGLLVRRSGRRLANLVGRNEPFAVAWRGLPMPPPELLRGGYSVIHSVKNDAAWPEARVREFFASRRPVATS